MFESKKFTIGVAIFLLILIIIAGLTRFRQKEVSVTLNNTNSDSIGILEPITFSIDKISEEEKKLVRIILSPVNDIEYNFENNNFVVNPLSNWIPSQNYTLSIFIENKQISSVTFKIKNIDSLTVDEKIYYDLSQIELEKEELESVYDQKPWLKSLPIIDTNYIVVYDYNKESIRLRIIDSEKFDADEIDSIQKKVTSELEAIGVPVGTKFDIIYD